MITAKVKCVRKEAFGSGTTLEFQPDYVDGRNKEWAEATPALSLTMTVQSAVAEHYEVGQAWTLQFVPTED